MNHIAEIFCSFETLCQNSVMWNITQGQLYACANNTAVFKSILTSWWVAKSGVGAL